MVLLFNRFLKGLNLQIHPALPVKELKNAKKPNTSTQLRHNIVFRIGSACDGPLNEGR